MPPIEARAAQSTAQPTQRRHDLDALRAFAMLLGIVLHGILSFIEGFWPVQDVSLKDVNPDENLFTLILLVIHGFRMPLFFLLSGFFTTLLWQRRGQAALLSHRARRVALPFLLGLVTIVPLMNWLSDRALSARFDQQTLDFGLGQAEGLETWIASFHHLWFLWFLLWMVAGFALVALFVGRRASANHASASHDSTSRAESNGTGKPLGGQAARIGLWVMPFASLLFGLISKSGAPPIWGPVTSAELVPDFWVLLYYGSFFAFGALLYTARTRSGESMQRSFGKAEWPWIAVSGFIAFVTLLVGLGLTYEGSEPAWFPATVVETIHTWSAAYALIGFFAIMLTAERYWLRYMSDASYWMYIAHLPLLIFLQDIVDQWDFPAWPKFLGIFAVCVGVLLLTYRFGVRYTPIGRLLNGRR